MRDERDAARRALGQALGLGRPVAAAELADARLRPAGVRVSDWMRADGDARVRMMLEAATPPDRCGPEVVAAPAAGPRRVVAMDRMVAGSVERHVPSGWQGRPTVVEADIFDRMAKDAARRGRPEPFSAGQVAIARQYRVLVEAHGRSGMRMVQLDRVAGGGEGCWLDAHMDAGRAIEALRRRVGLAAALRGGRGAGRTVTQLVLVDAVCLHQDSLSAVLRRHGWPPKGALRGRLRGALAGALDRMRCHV